MHSSEPDKVLGISDPGEVDRADHGPIDRFVVRVSNVIAWLFPILMLAIVAQIFLRGAGFNQAWLDDLQWWIYGFAMMAGFAYAITTNSHVRVDIFHQNFSPEKKARLEAVALGWMLLPFCLLMADILLHYAISSIAAREGSDSPNGLHGLYLLKSTLPVMFALAALASWAVFVRQLRIFSPGDLAAKLAYAFPAAVFLLWRVVHYVVYGVVRQTNPDLNPRRVTKEPVFDYLLTVSFTALVVVLIVLLVLRRGRGSAAGGTS